MNLSRQNIHRLLYIILLTAIAFTLPLFLNFNSFLIILLVVNWIAEGKFRQKIKRMNTYKWSWLYIGFFMIFLLSILLSDDTATAWQITEQKLSLLVFPLVFFSTQDLSKYTLRWVFTGFISGCLIAAFICIASAMIIFFETGATQQFFYHAFSRPVGMNAVYFSMYCLFCLILVIKYTYINFTRYSKIQKGLLISLILFFLLLIVLLSSKVTIISLFILMNIAGLFILFNRKKYIQGISLLLILNASLLLFISSLPFLKERFSSEFRSEMKVLKLERYDYDTPFSGLTLRATFWKFTIEILDERNAFLTGVGTGDAQIILNEKFREKNIYTGNPNIGDSGYLYYNVHSQYFQMLLMLGIIGLIYFMFILFIPAVHALQYRYFLFTVFLILFSIISLTESTLETHKGVVFFAMFNSLFAAQLYPASKNLEKNVN